MDDHYEIALFDICEAHSAFNPPTAKSVVEGAGALIIKQTGAPSTPWSPEETPYMVEPMNMLASRYHESEAFVGPARTGKTSGLLLGWMAHTVINDPGDTLFIQMSQDKAREFSKTDVSRSLDNSPKLTEVLSSSAADRNTHDVMFKNGTWLRIAWPTVSNVSGSTYRYAAITDYDRIKNREDVDGEGSLFMLTRKRVTTFLSRGMALVESSPGEDIRDPNWQPATPHEAPPVPGILGIYNTSDRRRWYWKCPHCTSRFEAAPGLSLFRLPSDKQLETSIRTADIGAMAKQYGSRIVPPCCGAEIPAHMKTELNRTGKWLADGQRFDADDNIVGDPITSKTVGYWLGGVAAAYQSWESLVQRHLSALLDYVLTGSEKALQTTANTDQGIPYLSRALAENQSGNSTPQERAVNVPRHIVPEWTRCLEVMVDVQGGSNARFVVQVHAVGPFMEQQLVDRFDITESRRPGLGTQYAPIDPASYPEDWDQITEKVLRATWRTPIEALEIRPLLTVVDTGGEGKQNGGEGVTHNAYEWYRRIRRQGLAGEVMLYKGNNTPKAPIIKETLVGGKDGKSADVPLYLCNPHLLSDAVDAGLRRATPGPGYIHFPKPHHPTTNPDGWLPLAFFDELHAEVRNADGIWEKVRKRNESFDLCRMGRAGMLRLGLDKLQTAADWANVPAALAPLAQNSRTISREQRQALQANTAVAPTGEVRVLQPSRRPRRSAAMAR